MKIEYQHRIMRTHVLLLGEAIGGATNVETSTMPLFHTAESMANLNEEPFRKVVIIPLLNELGLQGVFHWHGGSMELGKDVIARDTDRLGLRRNIAIVAKKGGISKDPKFSEVVNQVNQALNLTFEDPVNSEEQIVHECWIMANGRIPKETRKRLNGVIGPNFARVKILDIDDIWQEWRKHFPATVAEHLAQIQPILNEPDSPLQVEVSLMKDQIRYSYSATDAETYEKNPIRFHMDFEFPDSPEGLELLNSLQHSLKTGEEVTLPTGVAKIRWPDAFAKSFDKLGGNPIDDLLSFTISSIPSGRGSLLRLDFVLDDMIVESLDSLDMKELQSGTAEVTLTNADQQIPVLVRQRLSLADRTVDFNFSLKDRPVPAYWFLKFHKILDAIASGATVQVTDLATGIQLPVGSFSNVDHPEVPSAMIEFAENLVKFQRRANVLVQVPDFPFSDADVEAIGVIENCSTRLVAGLHGGISALSQRSIPRLSIPCSNRSNLRTPNKYSEWSSSRLWFCSGRKCLLEL